MNKIKKNEYEIIDIFRILWKDKFMIISCVAVVTLFGYLFATFNKPTYKTIASYKINFDLSTLDLQMIHDRKVADKYAEKLLFFLGENWQKVKNLPKLSLITKNKTDLTSYESLLNKYNDNLTDDIYESAINEVKILKDKIISLKLVSGEIINNLVNAERVIFYVESGKKVLTFTNIDIKIISPSKNMIILFSILFGFCLSILLALLKHNAYKGRENKQKIGSSY